MKDYQNSSFLSAEALYATFVGGTYKYIVEEETEDFEIVYRVRRDENYRYIIYITNDENGFAPEESQIIDLPPVRHSNDIDYVPKPKPDYGELMYKANYEPSTSLESNFTPIYTEKPKIETSSKASFTLPILLLLIISAILLMIITAF